MCLKGKVTNTNKMVYVLAKYKNIRYHIF